MTLVVRAAGRLPALAVALIATTAACAAEESEAGAGSPEETSQTRLGFRSGSFIALPIPVNDPTFGTGLVLGGGYLWQADEGSDTSFIGGGAFGTDEESYAGGLGGSLSFADGTYSLTFFAGAADVNYDLYLLGNPVRVQQEGAALQAEFLYGFTPTVSAGFSLRYLDSEITGIAGRETPALIDNLANNSLGTLGFVFDWDTRDDTIYPTQGGDLNFSSAYTLEFGGRELEYARTVLSYDHFWSLAERSVIGVQATGCTVADRAPFFDTCLLGQELRGFSLFQYFGDKMLTGQAEYRQRLGRRLGFVLFGGLGEVEKTSVSESSGVRYAGGGGLRFRVSQEFGLDMALDLAVNDEEETLVYFTVGQAF